MKNKIIKITIIIIYVSLFACNYDNSGENFLGYNATCSDGSNEKIVYDIDVICNDLIFVELYAITGDHYHCTDGFFDIGEVKDMISFFKGKVQSYKGKFKLYKKDGNIYLERDKNHIYIIKNAEELNNDLIWACKTSEAKNN